MGLRVAGGRPPYRDLKWRLSLYKVIFHWALKGGWTFDWDPFGYAHTCVKMLNRFASLVGQEC